MYARVCVCVRSQAPPCFHRLNNEFFPINLYEKIAGDDMSQELNIVYLKVGWFISAIEVSQFCNYGAPPSAPAGRSTEIHIIFCT